MGKGVKTDSNGQPISEDVQGEVKVNDDSIIVTVGTLFEGNTPIETKKMKIDKNTRQGRYLK
jgi:hypothetical protein